MKKLPITLSAISLVALLGLTGCTANPAETPSGSSVSPSEASVAPSDAAAVDVDSDASYGDVHAYKLVTDATGTYAATTINDDAEAMQYDAAAVDPAATELLPQEKILSAQQAVVKFVAEETLDSPALESTANWETWKTEVAPTVIYPTEVSAIIGSGVDETYDRSSVIENNNQEETPAMIRDGKPRSSETLIDVTKVITGVDTSPAQSGTYVTVSGTAKAKYRVTDATAIDYFKKYTPDATDEEMKADNPTLFDGQDGNWALTTQWTYTVVEKDNKWLLGSYTRGWTERQLNFS